MVESQLCDKCRGLFEGDWRQKDDKSDAEDLSGVRLNWAHYASRNNEPTVYRHHNYCDLKTSVEAGCRLCCMLWEADKGSMYETARLGDFPAVSVAEVSPEHDCEDKYLELFVRYFGEGQNNEDGFGAHQYVKLELQYAEGITIAANQVSAIPDTPMQQLVQLIERWCISCKTDEMHAECRSLINPTGKASSDLWLPSRLIDTKPGSEIDCIRVITSLQLLDKHKHVGYVTLSHCWGGMLPIRLLSENLNVFQHGVDVKELPKTFRDAITFVRLLGVRYLWIDALCIVQDDHADWLRESLLMAHVYSHAVLNIAATFSEDGHGGLFKAGGTKLMAPCLVDAKWSSFKQGQLLCLDHHTYRRKVEEGPLNRRAWVFQERMLAPRTVHFAQDQIWWECRKYKACETFPHGVPKDYIDTRVRFRERPNLLQPIVMPVAELLAQFQRGHDESAYQYWQWLVSRYTGTRMTEDSDRLIALAGITETVCKRMRWPESDYVAGWWKPDLVRGLLWRKESGQPSRTSLFPSWSWASCTGKAEYEGNYGDWTFPAVIFDVDVATTGGPFGHVLHGVIRLRAPLVTVVLSEPHEPSQRFKRLTMALWGNMVVVQKFEAVLDHWQAFHEMDQRMSVYFCQLMVKPYGGYDKEYSHRGLILQRAESSALGQYRRIGYCWLVTSGPSSTTPSSRQCDHEISYLEDHGDGSFTFTIC